MENFLTLSNFFYFFHENILFFWKLGKNEKTYSPLLIVVSQCSKNLPCTICFFSWGFPFKKNLSSHFRNLKPLKKPNYTWTIFHHTSRRQCMKKNPFCHIFFDRENFLSDPRILFVAVFIFQPILKKSQIQCKTLKFLKILKVLKLLMFLKFLTIHK